METGNQRFTTTYQLTGKGKLVITSIPLGLGMVMYGGFPLGAIIESTSNPDIGIFRAYLATPFRYGWYTLQIKVYSNVNNTNWVS